MLRLNNADRFSLAIDALKLAGKNKKDIEPNLHERIAYYQSRKRWHEKYVQEFGSDPAGEPDRDFIRDISTERRLFC
jgi:hypothetical protein